ncbi:hypothetical protein B0H19DRAFT_1200724 [Mycena capillaripes]|nr:hypothetical protein B0H19DRAFT_1200724 [Mycena capillaripes]
MVRSIIRFGVYSVVFLMEAPYLSILSEARAEHHLGVCRICDGPNQVRVEVPDHEEISSAAINDPRQRSLPVACKDESILTSINRAIESDVRDCDSAAGGLLNFPQTVKARVLCHEAAGDWAILHGAAQPIITRVTPNGVSSRLDIVGHRTDTSGLDIDAARDGHWILETGGRRCTDRTQCDKAKGEDLGEHFRIRERFCLLSVQESRVRFA